MGASGGTMAMKIPANQWCQGGVLMQSIAEGRLSGG
jgi:hypothetical protein